MGAVRPPGSPRRPAGRGAGQEVVQFRDPAPVRVLGADRMGIGGPQLLAKVLVDISTGTDSKDEHYERIVLNLVDHPVAADTDATPTGRSRQGDRTGRSRVLDQVADRLDHPPAGGDIEPADLLAG